MNSKNLAAFILATVIAAPAFADGQATVAAQPSGLTRAQVRAELVQLEGAGWRPSMDMGNNPRFPDGIQAAEAKVAAQNGATGVGGVVSGSSASGAPAAARPAANDGLNPTGS
jgi:hypothetical protein